MKIVQLTAANIKRLKAVCIRPKGAVVPITGKNAQGKSSVLDAITMALGGKDVQPPRPVREGAKHASVVLDLGDKVVTRTFSGESQTLTVQAKDGAKYSSPQKVLDSLVGELSFDPLAFTRMSSKEQLATLKRVANLDFDKLDAERARLFDQRTEANRLAKQIDGQLAFMPEIEAPDEEVSLQKLFEGVQTLNAIKTANDQQRQELDSLQNGLVSMNRERDAAERARATDEERSQREIQRLRHELKEAEETQREVDKSYARNLAALSQRMDDQTAKIRQAKAAVEVLEDPDLSAIQQQIAEAEETNRLVRAKKQRAQTAEQLENAKTTSAELTELIVAIDEQKREALAKANLPVPGLGFSDEGVTVNGLPFEQASSAEQLRVSVAMGIALNPKLRVLLIRDGSLLDDESLAILAQMAEEHDVQVWLERVSNGEPVGVVIEDGTASGPETVAPKK